MVNNNYTLIIISLFLVFISGCNMNKYTHDVNEILDREKTTFGIETNKSNLLEHFPKKIKNNNMFSGVYPPSCPPTYECSKQYGDIFLIVDKPDYQEELSKFLEGNLAYKTSYTDSNIIINLSELKRKRFPIEKCNKWHANKLPIPCFEGYNFGLGEKEIKKEIKGETYVDHTYNIPFDLQVYVIRAEAGDFWIESCNEKRPKDLKEWQHGYSIGFAISDEENIIVYWTMVW